MPIILADPPPHKGFNYSRLDAESRQFVQQQTGEIRMLMKRTAQGIVEIGQKLVEVKARLGHGHFGSWLTSEFEWSWETANSYMNVAKRMGQIPDGHEFEAKALYLLASPSTPESVREEALARAEAGEPITLTTAKEIKKKHTSSTAKSKSKVKLEPEQTPVVLTLPTPTPPLPPSSPLEIVAIRPPAQTSTAEIAKAEVTSRVTAPQPPQIVTPDSPGIWWQLSGRHLLYCGNPNSAEFLARAPDDAKLLLAFPPMRGWQPAVQASTRIIIEQFLPQGKSLDQLDESLESIILFFSQLEDLVVGCFLPSLDIVSILNRLSRRGLWAEPDLRRCHAIVSDWKRSGLKAERLERREDFARI